MRRLLGFTLAALVACGGSGGPTESPTTGSSGTATEQRLCADVRAAAPDAQLYFDANAVNNDPSTGPDDLSLEALAYINAHDRLPGAASLDSERIRLLGACRGV